MLVGLRSNLQCYAPLKGTLNFGSQVSTLNIDMHWVCFLIILCLPKYSCNSIEAVDTFSPIGYNSTDKGISNNVSAMISVSSASTITMKKPLPFYSTF